MKKLAILTSILALAACGGGSGSGDGGVPIVSNNNTSALGNIELPTSRVSSTAATSNSSVTGMDSSVTNISEMTSAVESAIGTDALNSIASDSDNISNVINRSASARHATLRAPGHHTDKEKGAYLFLEGGKRFKNWGHDKRRDFYREQPDMVRYWGKIFCGCNIDSYNEDQVLAIFDNDSNQTNWNNFYEQNHYREYTLGDVKFETMITPGQVDTMKFFVKEDGQIEGIAFAAGEGNTLEHIPNRWLSKIDRTTDNKFRTEDGADMEYNTYADDLNLRYTDFGVIGIDYQGDHFDAPFIAGYEDKKIITMPEGETQFTGIAKGTVEYASGENNDYLPIADNSATLTFNNGTETLHANFNNWYEVSISKTGMNLDTQHTQDEHFILNNENPTYSYFNANYYGDNNTPSEATALFQYQEKINPSEDIQNNNKTVYIGFGGKAD